MPSLADPQCSLTDQLRESYIRYQQAGKLPKTLAVRASPPLLLFPHPKWKAAKLKLLVVGQETRRWRYKPCEIGEQGENIESYWDFSKADHGVAAMWKLYCWYSLGRAHPKLNSPFWRGFRALDLAITGTEDGALWTNVFKVNVNGSVMRNCRVAEISALQRAQKGLLHREMTLLNPDVVVFLSGPHYDAALRCEFPDMDILPFHRRLPASSVGVVRAASLPCRAIRTFHPEYLQRSGQLGLLSDVARWAGSNSR